MIYSSGILLNSSLVGYWPLNGSAVDFKSANNGTLVAGTYDAVVPSTIGQATTLATGYINAPASSAYDFGTTTDFSIEFMFNTSNATNQQNYMDHRASAGTGWSVISTSGGIGTSAFNLTIAGSSYTGPLIGALNTWYHVVVVVKRTTNIIFYVNGSPTTVSTASNGVSASSATGQITLGSRAFTQPSFTIAGNMCNCAIYNTALSADVVTQHYVQFFDGMPTMPNVGVGKIL